MAGNMWTVPLTLQEGTVLPENRETLERELVFLSELRSGIERGGR